MKRVIQLLTVGVVLLTVAGCAPGPNPSVGRENEDGEMAGFWLGLWHGFIAPVTFVISLFSARVNVYEVFNSGGWYDLGFMMGLSASLGGSSGAAACRRRQPTYD